jgi:hypothetical protein
MKKSIRVDPVLSGMHEIKDANARRFDGDLGKQFRRFRELQALTRQFVGKL